MTEVIEKTCIIMTIQGKPFAKQRPRFSRRSGRAFTPQETVSFERSLGILASQRFTSPIEGPVRLTVIATFEPPKSWTKKKTAALMNRHHTQKPDLDNIEKAVKDALNRIAFVDDSQVAEMTSKKFWGPSAQTVIMVEGL